MGPTGSQTWTGTECPPTPAEPTSAASGNISAWYREHGGMPVNSWSHRADETPELSPGMPNGWWRDPEINEKAMRAIPEWAPSR